MVLKVTKEPKDLKWEPPERCCICAGATRYWHSTDVALCPKCAQTTKRSDLPSKNEWFDSNKIKATP